MTETRPDTEAVAQVHSAVGGLAREVEAMRRAMQQVATAGDLTRLQRLVGELGDTVAALAAAGAPEPARAGADAVVAVRAGRPRPRPARC